MSELNEIKHMGGKAQKNSGRGHYQKGDALLDIFTVDVKESAQSFTLSRAVWAKIGSDAFRNGLTEPTLNVVLGAGNDKVRLWVVADHIMKDYIRLRQEDDERRDYR